MRRQLAQIYNKEESVHNPASTENVHECRSIIKIKSFEMQLYQSPSQNDERV